jgi:hypothetical protein
MGIHSYQEKVRCNPYYEIETTFYSTPSLQFFKIFVGLYISFLTIKSITATYIIIHRYEVTITLQ